MNKTNKEFKLDWILSDDNAFFYDYYTVRKQILALFAETMDNIGEDLPDGTDKTCFRLIQKRFREKLEKI